MLKAIKKILGIEAGNEGKQIDFKKAWTVDRIKDRNKFLSKIIELVPSESIWTIEGHYDEGIHKIIFKHLIEDDIKVWKGTVWPKQNFIKVKLTDDAKSDILNALPSWNLKHNIIHQHIYKDGQFYLTSFDNLEETCTWVSMEFPKSELDKLKEDDIIDFSSASE